MVFWGHITRLAHLPVCFVRRSEATTVDDAASIGNPFAVILQAFDEELDGLLDRAKRLISGFSRGEAPAGGGILTVLRIVHGARNWPEDQWPEE